MLETNQYLSQIGRNKFGSKIQQNLSEGKKKTPNIQLLFAHALYNLLQAGKKSSAVLAA